MARLRVKQVRGLQGSPGDQRRTIFALGLRRIGHSVVHEDSPTIRGMIFKVKHMVEVTTEEDGS